MVYTDIVMAQMVRLNEISQAASDSGELCRIAETICHLGQLLSQPGAELPAKQPECSDLADDPLLSIQELVAATGLSRHSIQTSIAKDPTFPVIRVNRRQWFRLSSVRAWMAEREKAPREAFCNEPRQPQRLYQVK